MTFLVVLLVFTFQVGIEGWRAVLWGILADAFWLPENGALSLRKF